MLREDRTAARIQLRRGEVSGALADARAAAAVAAPLATAIARLARLIQAHGQSEEAEGVLEDILMQAPRLEAGVHTLQRDHVEMPVTFRSLAERAQSLLVEADAAFDRLSEHQSLVDHLMYEAYSTDLGESG